MYGPVLEHDTPSDYGGRDVVAVCLERCLQLLWLVCQTSNFHEQGQTDACHRHPTVAEYHTSDTVTGDCTIAERPMLVHIGTAECERGAQVHVAKRSECVVVLTSVEQSPR